MIFKSTLILSYPVRFVKNRRKKPFQIPRRSKSGVYSSLAEVRSWVKPSVMPQFSMYSTAERYSALVTWRARFPAAPGWGVYWLIKENSTSPGRKVADNQSMTRRVFSSYPGKIRCRKRTTRVSRTE